MVESALAIPTVVHCVDSHKLVENEFEKLLETHDALISTGGTAISKGDVVVDVTENIGKVLIHGVALGQENHLDSELYMKNLFLCYQDILLLQLYKLMFL